MVLFFPGLCGARIHTEFKHVFLSPVCADAESVIPIKSTGLVSDFVGWVTHQRCKCAAKPLRTRLLKIGGEHG